MPYAYLLLALERLAEVARAEVPGDVGGLLPALELPVADGQEDLRPAKQGHHGQRSDAVGHVSELERAVYDQVCGEPENLLHDVARHGEHGHAAVLQLHGAAAVEGLLVAVVAEACGW
jgi:hypothetical protein